MASILQNNDQNHRAQVLNLPPITSTDIATTENGYQSAPPVLGNSIEIMRA